MPEFYKFGTIEFWGFYVLGDWFGYYFDYDCKVEILDGELGKYLLFCLVIFGVWLISWGVKLSKLWWLSWD